MLFASVQDSTPSPLRSNYFVITSGPGLMSGGETCYSYHITEEDKEWNGE